MNIINGKWEGNVSKSQTLTKYQVAQKLGICSRTLALWLNVRYYEDLKKLGYIKTQRILMPSQIQYLQVKIDL